MRCFFAFGVSHATAISSQRRVSDAVHLPHLDEGPFTAVVVQSKAVAIVQQAAAPLMAIQFTCMDGALQASSQFQHHP